MPTKAACDVSFRSVHVLASRKLVTSEVFADGIDRRHINLQLRQDRDSTFVISSKQ